MAEIRVVKLDHTGKQKHSYIGTVVNRGKRFVNLEAVFDFKYVEVQGLVMERGDRFVETFFADRWYNIFQIFSGKNQQLKGWYCNIGPAELEKNIIRYRDLALDLIIFPDGRQVVVDEEEFQLLDLDEETRQSAVEALNELQEHFRSRVP